MTSVSAKLIIDIFTEIQIIAQNVGDIVEITEKDVSIYSMINATLYEISMDINLTAYVQLTTLCEGDTLSMEKSVSILRNTYDDSTSVLIVDDPFGKNIDITYLVRPENISSFIYLAIINDSIDWSLTYKNAQKIRSSPYGRALCDASIVCHVD